MTERKKTRLYTDEFKQQLVQLYDNGKRKYDILPHYWINGLSSPLALGLARNKTTALLNSRN